jgi:hypothetical protein
MQLSVRQKRMRALELRGDFRDPNQPVSPYGGIEEDFEISGCRVDDNPLCRCEVSHEG